MAKIDKSQYSKEEWRRIKEQSKQEKLAPQEIPVVLSTPISSKHKHYHVLCLKHGTKYSADYVNKLYNMVQRNCTLDIDFWCLTEDTKGLHQDIKTLPLPLGLAGWWCKPYIFSQDLSIDGTILYIDLDVVIAGNIDKLFTYQLDHWCTIRDFTRIMRPNWNKYNSSIIRFNSGKLSDLWENFKVNQTSIQQRFHGDQDWLYEVTKDRPAVLYPDNWILSWKWEVRKSKDFLPGGRKGERKLKIVEHVVPPKDCCITVFHGDPNPHNCLDPWVIDNWQ